MPYCNLSEIPNDLSSLSSLKYLDLSGNPFLSLSIRDEGLKFYTGAPILHISNETKGLKWTYVPATIGFPKKKEHMLWLSHWRFANDEWEGGDEIRVSVRDEIRVPGRDEFDMLTKEFGI
ncbi:hypothetical protein L3X38_034621 [Prunus dulcis]|uniref:Uncharacterized protein n=1 Tax=Prunus dulcis TaxID=3755 RepID=A0AAD4VKN2_PRUDU|nr:hypothetical protein L3X38_034621 [Prunus dulcis]